jgi:hypothetical protein
LAPRLGARGAAVRLPAGDPQDDLHEAALKFLFLAIRNCRGPLAVHWRRPIEWTAAMGQFAILFGDRFEPSAR